MEIRINNITKIINSVKIIDDVSLTVESGKVFGLIGPNGSGKTTIVRLMLNLYNLTEGEILIDHVKVDDKNFSETKKRISVVLDSLGLYKNLNTWDNIEFFDRIYYPRSTSAEREERISSSLKLVDLYERRQDNISFFSRGMRQRLALARAFNSNPSLLILDEPCRGLDLEGIMVVRDFIKELKQKGCTVFINSHNLSELQKVCDEYGFIRHGKILAAGKYKDIIQRYIDKIYLLPDNVYTELSGRLDHKKIDELKDGIVIVLERTNADLEKYKISEDKLDLEMLYKVM